MKLDKQQLALKKFVDSMTVGDLKYLAEFYESDWRVLKIKLYHKDHGEVEFSQPKNKKVPHD